MSFTKSDKKKILARYYTKLDEFKTKPLEELKVLYNSKISHTDKQAVLAATEHLMSLKLVEEIEVTNLEQQVEDNGSNITREQQEV